CFGFFVLGYHEPTRLSDEDQRYLRDARNMLYSAVETHYVVAQTQSSLEETGILYQLLRGLLVAENVEDVCATFVDYVADPTMEQVLFFELQDGPWHAPEAHLTSLARFQKHHQSPLPERLTRAAFAGWDILAHDRPTIVADTTADPALNAAQRAAFLEMGFGALVCFPWRYTNKLTGCLLMGSAAPNAFSERDERLSIGALDCLAHRILQLRGQMP
ncbi:MAG: GAF domain-containing protein, partial [Anaerolineales bacterium]